MSCLDAAPDDLNDAKSLSLDTQRLKPGAARFLGGAAIEVIVEQRDGEGAERVEDMAQQPARTHVLQ